MIVMLDLAPDLGQSAQRALGRGKTLADRVLVDPQGSFIGYGWYDAIPQVSGLAFTVEHDGLSSTFTDDADPLDRPPAGHVDRIRLDIAFGGDALPPATVTTDALIYNDDTQWGFDRVLPYLTRATITVGDLADLIGRASFDDSTDVDADSYYTQQAEFSRDARNLATLLLHGEEQALLDRMEELLSREIAWSVPDGRHVAITLTKQGATATFLTPAPSC